MNFEMTGKLSISKETEKFKPWDERKYDSGWVKRRLLFNVTCGDNRHMLSVDDGSFEDGHGDVYTFTKSTVDESGNKKKGESITIPFKERLTSPRIAEVAEFKKYIFDLEKPGRRYGLEKAAERLKEGRNLTDEELKNLGLENESEVTEALENSKKKRHEFITKWDYAEFIKKVIDSGKYSDAKFFIRGNGEYSYSENNERVYESYVPTRIYLAADDSEESSTATVNILFNSESLDTMSADEKKKYYVNGWMMEYDNNRRGNIPVPVTVTIPLPSEDTDQKAKRRIESLKHKFTVDDESIKEYGVVVNMLNGAQKTEITEDMLTDEQRDDLDCGLITMDDIRAELGSSVYGERIREYEFVRPARGFTKGRQETVYTAEDMVIRPIEETLPEGTEDLFDDDDDL
jgi:hypothetical protein